MIGKHLLSYFVIISVANSALAQDLYYFPLSPPSRVVMMTAKLIGKDLNLKLIDIQKGEQNMPEYIKMNPQHQVPVLVDGDVILPESRAIIIYLVDTYGKKMENLYPTDAKKRAIINARLFFDASSLFPALFAYIVPKFSGGNPTEESKLRFISQMEILDKYLEKSEWVAGSQFTLADISIFMPISIAEAIGIDISKTTNIKKWYDKTTEMLKPYDLDKINGEANKVFASMFK